MIDIKTLNEAHELINSLEQDIKNNNHSELYIDKISKLRKWVHQLEEDYNTWFDELCWDEDEDEDEDE